MSPLAEEMMPHRHLLYRLRPIGEGLEVGIAP